MKDAADTLATGSDTVPGPQEVLVTTGTWITRTAWRLHARMPWTEVDDMVQEGVMTALELRDSFDPARGVPFPIYVKPRVMGAMIDLSRQQGAIRRRENTYVAETDPEDRTEADALDFLISCEDVGALAAAIDALPTNERTAVSLFYLEELRNKDVAQVMAVSEVQALRLRKRALARLAETLRTTITTATPDTPGAQLAVNEGSRP